MTRRSSWPSCAPETNHVPGAVPSAMAMTDTARVLLVLMAGSSRSAGGPSSERHPEREGVVLPGGSDVEEDAPRSRDDDAPVELGRRPPPRRDPGARPE